MHALEFGGVLRPPMDLAYPSPAPQLKVYISDERTLSMNYLTETEQLPSRNGFYESRICLLLE